MRGTECIVAKLPFARVARLSVSLTFRSLKGEGWVPSEASTAMLAGWLAEISKEVEDGLAPPVLASKTFRALRKRFRGAWPKGAGFAVRGAFRLVALELRVPTRFTGGALVSYRVTKDT